MSAAREPSPTLRCGVSPSDLTDQQRRASGAESYRGWWIDYYPPPIPIRTCDWQYWHDDYDGAPDASDNRCGHAPSLEAAKAEIDAWEDDA